MQREATAAGLLDADRPAAFVEPALQKDEPALEVVPELGQLERRVETIEVRRAVANNSISINDVRITDANRIIGAGDINADGVVKLSHGKKKHALVVPG